MPNSSKDTVTVVAVVSRLKQGGGGYFTHFGVSGKCATNQEMSNGLQLVVLHHHQLLE